MSGDEGAPLKSFMGARRPWHSLRPMRGRWLVVAQLKLGGREGGQSLEVGLEALHGFWRRRGNF